MRSISAIILSGGLARRMDGANKGLQMLQGKPLIAHVIARIAPQVNEVLINANKDAALYAPFGRQVLADLRADFPGPLAGFEAGLQHLQNSVSEYLLTLPCDSPLLPLDLAQRLLNAMAENRADIAVATSNGNAHPVFCLMKNNALPSLQAFLDAGERKVSAWQKSQQYVEVDFSDCVLKDGASAFTNLNTREDLADLEQKLTS